MELFGFVFIDDNEVECYRRCTSNYLFGANIITLEYILDVSGSVTTDDIKNAKIKDWNSSKTAKVEAAFI